MAEPHRSSVPPVSPEAQPSLWRELADGTSGPVVRTVVSIALAPLLAGAALFGSFALAGLVPQWADIGRGYFGPSEELVAGMLGIAGFAYLASITWIWTRSRQRLHEFWKAGLYTVAVAIATIMLSVFMVESRLMRGSEDVLIGAFVCLGIAAVFLFWLQAGRRFMRGRPLHDPADGALDVRCPSCGYRMVGLRESRCPECGSAYTLDELLGRQEFLSRRPRELNPNGLRLAAGRDIVDRADA